MLSRSKELAFLAACCLFLATLDYLIPKPLPFMRIGLANLPLLIALPFFSAGSFLILLCAKVLLQGLIQGTLFSHVALFSFAGSLTSGLVMFLAYKMGKRHISLVGISLLGALTNNLVQLLLAGLLIFKQAIWFIGPPFLVLGSISGFILGTFAMHFSQKSQWLHRWASGRAKTQTQETAEQATGFSLRALPSRLFLSGLLIAPAFLLHNNLPLRLIQTGLFLALALGTGKRIKLVFNLLLALSLVAVHLLTPNGEVLFKVASLPVTAGAIQLGLTKATTLFGLLFLSLFAVHPHLHLPGGWGGLLSKVLFYFERLRQSYKQSGRRPEPVSGTLTPAGQRPTGFRPALKNLNLRTSYEGLIRRLDILLTQAYAEQPVTAAGPADSPSLGRRNRFTGKPLHGSVQALSVLVALNWLACGLSFVL